MSTTSLRRVAAVAAVATVGGVLPFFAAATASAAEPTNLTLDAPTAKTVSGSGPTIFTGSLSGVNVVPTHGVFANVQSGPDASSPPLAGSPCTITLLNFSCTVAAGGTPGVDSIRFFYDAAGTGTFQNADPFATGTLTVTPAIGPVSAVSLTPTTANAGAGGYQAYTATATDALGRAKSGVPVALTATETNANPAQLDVLTTAPAPGTIFGGSGGAGTATALTGTDGKVTFYVASSVVGTVALKTVADGNLAISSNGSLTVNPAGLNDVTSVQISPANQNAFVGKPVQQTITLRNAQGNPVAGVTPVVTIMSGPDAALTPTVGQTDGTGTTTVSYQAGATAGTDSVRAYVNQNNHPVNTNGLDAGEPSGTASVVVAAENITGITNSGPVSVPTDTTSAPVTFKVATSTGSAAGYNLQFSVAPTGGKYTLSQSSGVTDANGNVTVTVTNANPADHDEAIVTATLVGDPSFTNPGGVRWSARTAQSTVAITPSTSTAAANSSVTHTATVVDQFGAPVSGLDYAWTVNGRNNVNNNTGATGTGASFTYTDVGSAIAAGDDDVMVSVSRPVNGGGSTFVGTAHATQHFVVGTAQATQVNIDLGTQGQYVQNNPPQGPWVPSGFVKQTPSGVTADPTTGHPVTPVPVAVKLVDANGNALYGKSVSFSSNGVGVFTDANGTPIGNSTTATVSADTGGAARVYVRSTQSGTQTITATADGITDRATVSYTGQYNAVTPTRVLDSRTGQGGLMDSSGAPVVGGRLAPNSVYYFNYANTNMPLGAAAYAFNVTAIQPNGAGNLRVGPATMYSGVPQTSLVNYQAGKDIANFAIVPNGSNNNRSNTMAIYTDSASVSVAIDMVGSYPTDQGITTVNPSRVVDTRTGLGGGAVAPVAAGTSRSFQIGGTGDIPATGAKAVALNVTAINPSGLGNLRIYADGQAVPNTSIINYVVGQDKAAYVIVDLPANGKIDVFSDNASADVAIDAFAYFPTSSNLVTSTPTRILDTRTGGTLAANTPASFQVAGRGGVPADAQAVLVSVTAIHNANSTGLGNLRVYPTGTNVPFVSTLNYLDATSDVANFAIVKLGTNGQVSLYSDSSPIDVAVDVVGYYPAGS